MRIKKNFFATLLFFSCRQFHTVPVPPLIPSFAFRFFLLTSFHLILCRFLLHFFLLLPYPPISFSVFNNCFSLPRLSTLSLAKLIFYLPLPAFTSIFLPFSIFFHLLPHSGCFNHILALSSAWLLLSI